MKSFFRTLLASALLPFTAMADDFGSFETAAVADAELDDIRGGALQIGNMVIDYSYLAQLHTQLQGQEPQLTDLVRFSTGGNGGITTNAPINSLNFQTGTMTTVNSAGAIVNLNQVIDIVISNVPGAQGLTEAQNQIIFNALANRSF